MYDDVLSHEPDGEAGRNAVVPRLEAAVILVSVSCSTKQWSKMVPFIIDTQD